MQDSTSYDREWYLEHLLPCGSHQDTKYHQWEFLPKKEIKRPFTKQNLVYEL